jgi:hypothetical protein
MSDEIGPDPSEPSPERQAGVRTAGERTVAQTAVSLPHRHLLQRPLVRLVTVWGWTLVGPLLLGGVVLLVLHTDLTTARRLYAARPYLAVYFEFVSAGLLPLLYTLVGRESLARYGLRRTGGLASLLLAGLVGLVAVGITWGRGASLPFLLAPPALALSLAGQVWYAVSGVVVYGPLEVFFFLWVVVQTGDLFASARARAVVSGWARLPWEVVLMALLFGGLHLLTTQSVTTAVQVGLLFAAFGLVFQATRNAVGPMLVWTVLNGQVWFFVALLAR